MSEHLVNFLGPDTPSSTVRSRVTAPVLDFTVPEAPEQTQTPLQTSTARSRSVNEKIRAASQNTEQVNRVASQANRDTLVLAKEKGQQERAIVNEARVKVERIIANPVESALKSLFGNDDFNAKTQTGLANAAKERFAQIQRNAAGEISLNNSRKAEADKTLKILVDRGTRARSQRSAELEGEKFSAVEKDRRTKNALAADRFKEDKLIGRSTLVANIAGKLEVIEQNKIKNAQALKDYNEKVRNNEFNNVRTAAAALAKIEQDKLTNERNDQKLLVSMLGAARNLLNDSEKAEQLLVTNAAAVATAARADAAAVLAGEKFDETKRATGEREVSALRSSLLQARSLMRLLNNDIDVRTQRVFENAGSLESDRIARGKEQRAIASAAREVQKLDIFIKEKDIELENKALVVENLKTAGEKNVQLETFTRAAIADFDLRLIMSGTPEGELEGALLLEQFPEADLTKTDVMQSILNKQQEIELGMAKLKQQGKPTVASTAAREKEAVGAFFSGKDEDVVSGAMLDHIATQTKDGSVTIAIPSGGSVTIPADRLSQELKDRRNALFARQIEETTSGAARIQVVGGYNRDSQNLKLAQAVVETFGGVANNAEFQSITGRLNATREFLSTPGQRFSVESVKALSIDADLNNIIDTALKGVPSEVASLVKTGLQNYMSTSIKTIDDEGVESVVPNSGTFGFTTAQASNVTSTFLGVPTNTATFAASAISSFKSNVVKETKAKNPTFDFANATDTKTMVNLFASKTNKSSVRAAIQTIVNNRSYIAALNNQLLAVEEVAGLGVLLSQSVEQFPKLNDLLDSTGSLKKELFTTRNKKGVVLSFNEPAFVEALVGMEDPAMMAALFASGQEPQTEQNIRQSLNFTERQFMSAANYALISGGRLPGDDIIRKIANFKGFIANTAPVAQ